MGWAEDLGRRVVLTGCLTGVAGLAAQSNGPGATATGSQAPGRFTSSVALVPLNVTVTDAHDQPVQGLTREDFVVRDEGVPQAIEVFKPDAVPLDLTLLIDTSSSIGGRLSIVQRAGVNLVRSLRPGDRGSIVGFAACPRVLQEWTPDIPSLERALRTTRAAGDTGLYQSIYVALRGFGSRADGDGVVRRQAIVVLTDGEDTKSLISADDLFETARRTDTAVYVIASRSRDALPGMQRSRRTLDVDYPMRTLARETGGRFLVLEEPRGLSEMYKRIMEELASQYLMAYAPNASGQNASFRRLQVATPRRPGLQVRTRAGYYADAAVGAKSADGTPRRVAWHDASSLALEPRVAQRTVAEDRLKR